MNIPPEAPTPSKHKTILFWASLYAFFICSFLSLNANTQSLILNLDSKGFISVFTDHVFSRHFYLKSCFVFLSGVFLFQYTFAIVLLWLFLSRCGVVVNFVSMPKVFCSFTCWWTLWFCISILVCFYCSCDNHWQKTKLGRKDLSLAWVSNPSLREVKAGAHARMWGINKSRDHGP